MDRVTQVKQEIFNDIWAKAYAQKFEPSFSESEKGLCAYRGANGQRCNVGHLIPDDRYDPKIEGEEVHSDGIFERTTAYDRCVAADLSKPEMRRVLVFLQLCQEAHDYSGSSPNPSSKHRSSLVNIAGDAGLSIPGEAA